jgi:alpha-L-rhamnosidase
MKVLLLGALAGCVAAGGNAPTRLRLEYIEEPRGIDVVQPRFTWALSHGTRGEGQTAYQILVTKSFKRGSTVWDSGKVMSPKSQNIKYSGTTALEADTSYTWKVKFWDRQGVESAYSSPSTFTTGLWTTADWKGAKWIGVNAQAPGTQMRVAFNTTKPILRATAYVVGLGYYKMEVNGVKVTSHELGPFLTFEKRVYYDSLDVTEALESNPDGSHVLGVMLGNGWYSQPKVAAHTKGAPKMLMRLSIQGVDGSNTDVVSSDDPATGWMQHTSPVVMDDIYNGETYNASMETPGWTTQDYSMDGSWGSAQAVSAPGPNTTISSHAVLPPIKIMQTFSPCDMWQSSPGVYVFDFCQNMAGFTTLNIPAGLTTGATSNISLLHAEAIHGPKPASIFHHYGNTKETLTYLTKSDGEAVTYTPLFTYMGFRYVQLTGYPGVPDQQTLSAHFVHTSFEYTGSVGFSDPDLDSVQHITRTASMSNFMSIPTDCPQRSLYIYISSPVNIFACSSSTVAARWIFSFSNSFYDIFNFTKGAFRLAW